LGRSGRDVRRMECDVGLGDSRGPPSRGSQAAGPRSEKPEAPAPAITVGLRDATTAHDRPFLPRDRQLRKDLAGAGSCTDAVVAPAPATRGISPGAPAHPVGPVIQRLGRARPPTTAAAASPNRVSDGTPRPLGRTRKGLQTWRPQGDMHGAQRRLEIRSLGGHRLGCPTICLGHRESAIRDEITGLGLATGAGETTGFASHNRSAPSRPLGKPWRRKETTHTGSLIGRTDRLTRIERRCSGDDSSSDRR